MNRDDQKRLKDCEGLLSKGRWEEASRVLEEVTQGGQATLEYEVQMCAVLKAAGKVGQVREVAQRLDR